MSVQNLSLTVQNLCRCDDTIGVSLTTLLQKINNISKGGRGILGGIVGGIPHKKRETSLPPLTN